MTSKRYYVYFMGAWFSLNQKQWKGVCKEAVENDGAFTLSQEWELKHRPAQVKSNYWGKEEGSQYYTTSNNVEIRVNPCSDIHWFKSELSMLEQ